MTSRVISRFDFDFLHNSLKIQVGYDDRVILFDTIPGDPRPSVWIEHEPHRIGMKMITLNYITDADEVPDKSYHVMSCAVRGGALMQVLHLYRKRSNA